LSHVGSEFLGDFLRPFALGVQAPGKQSLLLVRLLAAGVTAVQLV
jgi:hypothetical protein